MSRPGGGPEPRRGTLAGWGIAAAVLGLIGLVVLAPGRDSPETAPGSPDAELADAMLAPPARTSFPIRREPLTGSRTRSDAAALPPDSDPDWQGTGRPGL